MAEVACIGECMIELSEHADGRITRAFGGDTLNTAVYLARLGIQTDYVTALGDDGWSAEMVGAWQSEGIGTARVMRLAGRLPGLYVIQTDPHGERRFSYWRDRAPAREIFATPTTDEIAASLADDGHIYLSGISLSLYGTDGRRRLFAALAAARAAGARVVFDTNYRTRGWPLRDDAIAAYGEALGIADMIFASVEDLDLLFGSVEASPLGGQVGRAEIVLKLATPGCRLLGTGADDLVMAPAVADVVDTTAAGDSFAAAYLAARLRGAVPRDAAQAGHRLAGRVVQHRGAIIAKRLMP